MPDAPFSHARVKVDRQVSQRAAVYHGACLKATSGGTATVDVYDGIDASGDPIDTFRAGASDHDIHVLEKGLSLRYGLYVDLGSNVDFYTVYYEPVARERG